MKRLYAQRKLLVAVTCSLVLAASGCGSSESAATTEAAATTAAETTTVAAAEATTTAAESETQVARTTVNMYKERSHRPYTVRLKVMKTAVPFTGTAFLMHRLPSGELRWKAPQKLTPWDGVLETKESQIASQTASVQASKDKAGNGEVQKTTELLGSEEGAVTLDITRPDTDETNLPILFYLHGGNNQTGKSAALPATTLAQDTNSIVVSITTVWDFSASMLSRH